MREAGVEEGEKEKKDLFCIDIIHKSLRRNNQVPP